MLAAFAEVPFANHGGLIPAAFEVLRHIGQAVVDMGVQGGYPINVVVGTGENTGPAWRTYRVGDIAMI